MIVKTRIIKAILERDIEAVKKCIEEGEDVQYRDSRGRSYLHLSVHMDFAPSVELFSAPHWLLSLPDNEGVTPLHIACRHGHSHLLELLSVNGTDFEARANGNIDALHIVSAYGHVKCLLTLSGYMRQAQFSLDANHHNPVHYAANEGHVEMIYRLADCSFDVNAENRSGNRPLHFAATHDKYECCQALLDCSAYIDAQNNDGQTALHMAVLKGCPLTVKFLLGMNADPNIRDSSGNTCSHLAIKGGRTEMIRILISDTRIDPSISDNAENTVLHLALKLGHFNLIPMMLPLARDLTRRDANGCSVIIEAIKNQLEDLALQMLKVCPSLVHTATNELVTPLHLAAERGMTHLTKQLLIAGAQVDAADAGGLTPSLYCAKNDAVLECLAMIEDLMMVSDNSINDQEEHVKENGVKPSSRISS